MAVVVLELIPVVNHYRNCEIVGKKKESNNNTCLVFNFRPCLSPLSGSTSFVTLQTSCRRQTSAQPSAYSNRKSCTLRSEATWRTQESALVFISMPRRPNSETITRKITQREDKNDYGVNVATWRRSRNILQ